MKACVATGEKRKIEYREIPTPALFPGTILLKTIYACICGSDLEYLDGSFGLMAKDVPPDQVIVPGSVPGHEFVAEVVGVGEGVNAWKVGDRAVPGPGIPGVMQPRPVALMNRQRFGTYETYRSFAEYMLTAPQAVQRVPEHVSNEEAVFVEPLSTGIGSVIASGVKPGLSVVIIGCGKIGLLAMMSAKVSGSAPVIMVDVLQPRLDRAEKLGADAVINARDTDPVAQIMKLTGTGADAVIIGVRDGKVLNQAVEMVRNGGTIVLAGFVPPVEVNPMVWTVRQLKIIGILGGPSGITQNVMSLAMYMISHKQIDPRPIITEVFPLSEGQKAIDSVYSGKNVAVLLKP